MTVLIVLSALPQEAQIHVLELGSCLARLAAMLPPVPPWAVGNTPEPVSLDIDGFIDVVAYVRLEEDLSDIQYGVLDIQVNFHHEGSLMNVYLLHFFALAENMGDVRQ